MTIAYVNKGTVGDGTGNASPTSVPFPASLVVGNMLLLLVQSGSTTNLVASTPSGWAFVGNILGGDASAYSTTTGPRNVAAFSRIVDGSEGASVAVTWDSAGGGGAEFQGQIHQFSKTAGAWGTITYVTGQDTSVGNGVGSVDVTSSTSLTVAANDMLVVFTGLGNDALLANPALTMSGVTLANVTEREAITQAASRGGMECVTADVSTSGTAAVRLVADNLTDPAGAATIFIRLSEAAGGGSAIKRWTPQMQGGMRSLSGGTS